ncbi:ABC transporter ATP-binding protein [Spiroplasma endosymbiont of Aspidapion aeneum]|uniref:ABC transporter ATP-binding protein n=1 Tax=Spiroplasma endosymbiont of Aspidapion aeneum TaxID=3066276 RepID=UPI00313BABA5
MSLIKIENITKKYNNNLVLKGVDLEISDNKSLAIIGANGSGKTTLVQIIAGLTNPTNGVVTYFNNIDKQIGFQFQEGNWPKNSTPIDLIILFKGLNWRKDEYVSKIFEIFEIDEILRKSISNISGGQKQRFNTFIALINKPKLLIVDELINGLDIRIQIKILNYFKALKDNKELLLIMVSHNSKEIELLCDEILLLDSGKVKKIYKKTEVIEKYSNVERFLEEHFKNYDE